MSRQMVLAMSHVLQTWLESWGSNNKQGGDFSVQAANLADGMEALRPFFLIPWSGHHIYIYTYAPPPGLCIEKIRKWLVYTISWCTCKLPQTTAAPVVVYIESVVCWAVCVYTKILFTPAIFLFFSRPKPGCGEYIWCPYMTGLIF